MALLGSILKRTIEIGVKFPGRNTNALRSQTKTLKKLLSKAEFTSFGEHYNFTKILSSPDLVKAFQEGGFMMYPILILGIIMVAITVERTHTLFFNMKLNKDEFFKRLTSFLLKGDINGMISVCDHNPAPLSKVVKNCLLKLINDQL